MASRGWWLMVCEEKNNHSAQSRRASLLASTFSIGLNGTDLAIAEVFAFIPSLNFVGGEKVRIYCYIAAAVLLWKKKTRGMIWQSKPVIFLARWNYTSSPLCLLSSPERMCISTFFLSLALFISPMERPRENLRALSLFCTTCVASFVFWGLWCTGRMEEEACVTGKQEMG